jgi:drug/metabolite transporter (DMT)-like permease
MLHLLALLGVISISFSAVFVRLASVSPVTATFYRAAYALPVLAVLWVANRDRDGRGAHERLMALAAGAALALDLAFWHESIALIGAGLATVIANVQIVFVAGAAWLLYRERVSGRAAALIVAVVAGIGLTSGFARHDAYGAAPYRGVLYGVVAGACYSGFLLIFRASNRVLAPTAGPLLDATFGAALGALLCAPFDPGFSLTPVWPAHAWLVLLALVAQVMGWLGIATALPRLPAVETSVLLLVQPVFALVWGRLFFAEHLSVLQWCGSVLVLAGVASISMRRTATEAATMKVGSP